MKKHFANIGYIKDRDEIPVKYSFLKKSPKGILNWYIKKTNPYIVENIELLDEEGYNIKLPILEEDMEKEESQDLLYRTLSDLYDMDVSVINFNKDYDFIDEFRFFRPKGDTAFSMIIREIMLKAIKYKEVDLKYADVCIIGEENLHTKIVLDKIYPEVNFLSLIVPKSEIELFDQTVDDIFNQTGLNIQVSDKNTSDAADIIINTSNQMTFDYSYKRDAIYIEPPKNKERFNNLISKREDLFAVNNCTIDILDSSLNLKDYETWLYLTEPNFRRYKGRVDRDNIKRRKRGADSGKKAIRIKHLYKNNTKLLPK